MEQVKHKKCIYPQFRDLKVVKIEEDFLRLGKQRIYDCNYDLIDNKTNKFILSKRKTACFSQLVTTHPGNNYYLTKDRDYTLNVFICKSEIKLSDKDFKKFVRLLRVVGKFKFKTLKNYNLENSAFTNYNYLDDRNITVRKAEDVYLFSIKYKDFRSMEDIKLLIYTLRYTYEKNMYKLVERYLKYKEKYPKAPFLSVFYMFNSDMYGLDGHIYCTNFNIVSDKEFLKQWEINNPADKYHGNAFEKLSNIGYILEYQAYNGWYYKHITKTKSIRISNFIKEADLNLYSLSKLKNKLKEYIEQFKKDEIKNNQGKDFVLKYNGKEV